MESTNTWEVPREQWASFLTQIEALQRDKPVQIELIGPAIGDQPLAQNTQLRALSVARKGTSAGTIELDLGGKGELNHRVLHPARIYVVQAPSGLLECLDIEDESRTKTLIRFKEPLSLRAGDRPAPTPARQIRVREYMTSPVHVLISGSALSQARQLMQTHRVRHLPVVDSNGRLVGILSDRDLHLARERVVAAELILVDEVMVRWPYTVSPNTRLDEAAAVMAQRKYGSAVVVEDDRVVGVLTTTDALRALVQLQAQGRGEWLA